MSSNRFLINSDIHVTKFILLCGRTQVGKIDMEFLCAEFPDVHYSEAQFVTLVLHLIEFYHSQIMSITCLEHACIIL